MSKPGLKTDKPESRWKFTWHSVEHIILILTFLATIYFGLKSHFLEEENHKLAVENISLGFKPDIKIMGLPITALFDLRQDTVLKQQHNEYDSEGNALLPAIMKIGFTFKLVNVGNANAKKFFYILLDDTISEIPLIRQIILKQTDRLISMNMGFSNHKTHLLKDIDKLDTIKSLYAEKTITHLDPNNELTMHCLFFYQGENGILYDTYAWIHLKLKRTFKFAVKNPHLPPDSVVTITNFNCCDKHIYSISEKESIKDILPP